jgi:octopine/nopaline transport system substrate-binding protein
MRFTARFVAGVLAIGAIAGMVAVAAPATAKDWTTVVVGTEGAYPPWNNTNSDGTLSGFEVDLLNVLCERMQVTCKTVTTDWDGSIPSLNAGKFDVLMDAVSITPERQKVIAFSIPYAATPATFAADKTGPMANLPLTGKTLKLTGDPAHDGPMIAPLLDALKGKSIGIQTATVYTKFIVDEFGKVADIRQYKTAAEHDLDLSSGRIDVAFDDATYFKSAFAESGNENLAYTGPMIAGSIWGPGEGFGIRKEDTDLKAMFDKAIQSAIDDGTVKKFALKWFGVDVTP